MGPKATGPLDTTFPQSAMAAGDTNAVMPDAGAGHQSLGFVRVLEVFLQQITTKVVLEIAPDSVDVVGIVLSVVVLEEERRSVDAVIVSLATLE